MSIVQFKEVRKLIVPIEGAVDAVLELDRCHGGRLARAKLIEAQIEAGETPGLLLVVRHATAGAPQLEQKRYALPAVAAAVIHYCSRREVPLPRRATKTIEVVPEGFELTLASVTEVESLHGEVPHIGGTHSDARAAKFASGFTDKRSTATFPTEGAPIVATESELSEASAAVG